MRAIPILCAAACAVALARPAEAGCDYASPFELYDRADRVVVGKVGPNAFVAVDQALKGHARGQIKVNSGQGMCRADVIEGDRVVLFLDKAGGVEGGLEGVLTIDDPKHPNSPWAAEMEAWGKAADDLARLDLLLGEIEHPELDGRRSAAADYLVNTPRLLAKIDAPRRARIVKALAGNKWHPNYVILILARLRAPELPALLADHPSAWSYVDEMKAFLAVDKFTKVADRSQLALAMVAKASSPAERAAAVDRCEQLRGERLERFLMYLYDAPRDPKAVDWQSLAAACKR